MNSTPSKAITIFGREPAMWVGLIEAALVLGLSFVAFISSEQAALVMAVVYALAGLYVGWATKDVDLARIIGGVKALVALVAGFGFALADTQQAAILAFVSVAFALVNRDRTSPVADPIDPSPQQVVPTLPTEDVAERLIPGTQVTDPLETPVDPEYDGFGAPIHERPEGA